MSAPTVDETARLLADPLAYTDEARLHAALTHLRASAPVSWVEVPNYRPFWAITKHADIMDIERNNMLFTNWPRPVLTTAEGDDAAGRRCGMLRTLIHMDDPQHRVVRAIGADWFRPKAMRGVEGPRRRTGQDRTSTRWSTPGPNATSSSEVAVNYPLYVILSLLGLPEDDFPRMLKLTQELFGSDDSEFKRGATTEEQLPALLDILQLLQRADRVAPRTSDRGPRVGDRQRTHRRRAAVRHGHRVLLRDHRHRRSRHHQRDRSPAGCTR